MANSTRKMNVEIGFMANKKSLEDLKLQLNGAIAALKQNSVGNEGLKQDVKVATELQQILNKCYNADLGTVNIGKFSTELKKANISVGEIRQSLAKAGNSGVVAFDNLQRQILSTKMEIKESSKVLNDMAKTFYNAFKYNVATKAIQTVTGSLERAVGYAEQLDHSLNDIRIVTDKSAESMEKFAKDANKASKQLGSSTLDYTNASLIYYQQGLSDSEVKARTETTLKVANVTGQTGDQVSEELTAVWNGYKVSAEEAETYVDKLAAVAATTASDLEELSTGMSKVASAAASMGVDVDQLNGMLSTIISVTRQAPESAGTALKTIFARMGDLELDGEDEYGVKLGEVSSSLASMGVQLLDTKGNMRDLGEVIEEVGNKWNSGAWSDAEKQALAIDLAGKRQYNNLLALFDNWQMYNSAVQTSADSVGTLQHQQDIYLESTDAKLTQLKATWQGLYDTIIDNGELNKGIEGLTNVVDAFEKMLAGLGGGMKSIAGFGLMISNIFNKQISEGLLKVKKNAELAQRNVNALNLAKQAANEKIEGPVVGVQGKANHAAAEKQAELYREIEPLVKTIGEDQYNNLITEIDKTAELEKQLSLQKSIQSELDEEISKNKELSDVFKERFESTRQKLAQDTDYEKATDAQLDAATYEKMGEEAQEELDKLREQLKTENEDYERAKNKRDSDFNRIDRSQEKRSSDKINRSVANINTGTQDFVNNTLDWKRTKDGKGVGFVNSNGQYKSEKEMNNLFSSQIKTLEEKIALEEKVLEEADEEASEVIKDQIKKLKEKLEKTKKALESSVEDAQKIISSSAKGNGILSEERANNVEEKTKNSVRQYQDDFEKSATEYANESKKAKDNHDDTVKILEEQIAIREDIVKYAKKGLDVASQTADIESKILAQEQKTRELARAQAEDNVFRAQAEAIQGSATALISLNSLSQSFVDIWSDSDLSFGDKLTQSFTTATFLLPQIIKGYKSISALGDAIAAKESLFLLLEQGEVSALIAQAIVEGKITQEKLAQDGFSAIENALGKERTDELIKELMLEKQITEEEAEQVLLEQTKNATGSAKNKGVLSKTKDAVSNFTSGIFGKIKGVFSKIFTALASKFGAIVVKALLGGAAAFAGIAIAGFAVYNKIQEVKAEKRLEKAQKDFEKSLEKYEKVKNKVEESKEISNKYKDLKEQKENGTISSADFKTQVSELLAASGNGDLMTEILAGDLETVSDALEKNTEALYAQLGDEADTLEHKAAVEVEAAIQKNAKKSQLQGFGREGNKLDLVTGSENRWDTDLLEEINALSDSLGQDSIFTKKSGGFIEIDKLGELYAAAPEELEKILANSNATEAKRLEKLLLDSSVQSAIDNVKIAHDYQNSIALENKYKGVQDKTDAEKESLYQQTYNEKRAKIEKDFDKEKFLKDNADKIDRNGNGILQHLSEEFEYKDFNGNNVKGNFDLSLIKQAADAASYEADSETIDALIDAINEEDKTKIEEALKNLTEEDIQSLEKHSEEFANGLKAFGLDDSNAAELINEEIDRQASEAAKSEFGAYDANFIIDKDFQERLNKFKEGANEDVKTWIDSLSKSEQNMLMASMNDIESLTGYYGVNELKNNLERQRVQANATLANENLSNVDTIEDDMITNKYDMHTIGSSKEFSELSQNFETIRAQVPELSDEIDILQTNALVGTQMWNSALQDVQATLDQFKLEGLNQQFEDSYQEFQNYIDNNGAIEKIKIGEERSETGTLIAEKYKEVEVDIFANEDSIQEFQDKLDSLLDAEYAIDIEIHAQAEDAYEDFMNSTDQITAMADKIGESYVVAADDVRELNQVFPGILENATYCADGTMQLNKEVAESAIATAALEEQASAEETIAELEDQKAKLVAKRDHYKTILEIATKAANGEKELDEAATEIGAELNKLESENDTETTKAELENNATLADSSQENASIMAKNWDEAYKQAAQADVEWANQAIANQKEVAKGDGTGKVTSNYNTKFSKTAFQGGNNSFSATEAALKDGKALSGKDAYAQYAADVSNLIASMDKEIYDIDGMIAGTKVKSLSALNDLKNRGTGNGSGKSSGSSSDADTMDLLNDELDIYHDINIEIEKQEKLLSRLEKEAENLYGQQLIDNLNKQNDALEAENVALEKKHELMLQDIKDRQKVLNAQGVSFDENGQVIDYNGLLAQREAYVNSEIAKYNAMDANSQKAYKNVVEQAKTDYETLKTQLEAYEELVNETLPDLEDTMDEKRKQVLANNLKKWETEIEIHLDLKEAEREWNDFLGDIMADFTKQWEDLDLSFDMNVKDFNTYLGDDGTLATRAQEIKDIEAEIDKLEKTGKSDKYESITQAQEALKQAQKDWMGDVQAFRNAYKAAYDDYMKEIDQIGDKFDSIIDKYKHINELLDFQKDLIGLIYGDEAYGLMSDYYDAQIYNNNSMIDSYKQQLDADRALLSTLKEGDEDYEKVQKRIMENENNMNKLILDNIKLIKEDYANSIKAAADLMMKNITGMSYSAMSEEWDKIKAENADHFDEIQSMYQIANFESTVKIAIDDAGSLKAQQKLQELYEQEVATLKEREELTQYDIDAANKRLEIAQKEIALENAQNAKNSMKVVRGTDGNWSYQYVADDDDLESKRQDLANSYAELYEMAKKAEEEAYDNLMNNYDKTVERLVNMVEKGYISEEEFKQAMLQAQEDFELQSERIAERDKIYRQDMLASSVAIANVAYATDAKNFSEKNAEMTKVVEECMTANASSYSDYAKLILDESSSEGLSAIGNQVYTIVSDANPAWTSGIGALAAACGKDSEQKKMIDEFWEDANQAISDYHTKIGDVEAKSGTSFGKVKNSIDSCKTSTDSLANATSEVVEQMDALYNKKSVLDEMANQWNNVKGAVESTKNEIDEYLKKVQASIEQTKKDLSSLGTAYANAQQPTTVSSGGNSSGGDKNLTYNPGGTTITYDYVIQSDPNGVYGTYGFYKKGGSLITMSNTEKNLIAEIRKDSNYKKTYKGKKVKTIKYKENGSNIITLATGGYTGEWGAEGKMAMLHEKELVLNKQDTSNILSVVNMVRGIVDGIGGGMLNKLASVANSGVTSNSAMNESSNVVYNVSCEFPNAGDIATIQEAIYTLPDKLTQMFGQRTVR